MQLTLQTCIQLFIGYFCYKVLQSVANCLCRSCVGQSYIRERERERESGQHHLRFWKLNLFPKTSSRKPQTKSVLHHLCRCAVLFLVVPLKFLSSLSSLRWGELLQVWVCFQSLGGAITGLGLFSVAGERYYRSGFVSSCWGELLQVWVCFQSLGRDITGLGLFPVAGERCYRSGFVFSRWGERAITGLGFFSVAGERDYRSGFLFSRRGKILQVWVCFQSLGREITGLGLFSVGLSSYPTPYSGPESVKMSQLVSVLLGLLQLITIYCRYQCLSVFQLVNSPLP